MEKETYKRHQIICSILSRLRHLCLQTFVFISYAASIRKQSPGVNKSRFPFPYTKRASKQLS